ncbi:unnamed protein product [Caenorhabditis sp. 36 PRJEB53466]|nr:unnamed protein product [Caenorhabditis sp. 36 PRJEB53466]
MRQANMIYKNYILYFFLIFGAVTNIYLIVQLKRIRFSESSAKISCDIDVENLMSLMQSSRLQEHNSIGFADENGPTVSPPTFEKTVQTSLFAFPGSSGLGNKLFELIALRGIADTLQRTPVINVVRGDIVESLFNRIQPIFPAVLGQYQLRIIPSSAITRQQANFGACCKFDDPFKFVNNSAEHLLLDGHYFQSFKYFSHLRSHVRQWLTPNKLAFLRAEILMPASHREDFIICTHVRRGDFQSDGVHEPSSANFTRYATDYLVEEYQKTHERVTVVVLGNDITFAYTVFEDRAERFSTLDSNATLYNYTLPESSPEYTVILTPTLDPEIDLAFSRAFCDVTLITAPSSTFGWWISYLAKPSAISYYRDIVESKDGVAREMKVEDFYPPNWIKLETDPSGRIRKSYVHSL